MRRLTKKQLLLVELVEQGLSVEEIASRTGKLVASVQMQLNRIQRQVREGLFAPSPLIERAAMTPCVYLGGFDVFRSVACSHDWGYIVDDFGLSLNLMLACTAQIVVGDVSAWHDDQEPARIARKYPAPCKPMREA
jgi:hypothetical protein